MKELFAFKNLFVSAVVLSCSLGFTSCSDDDEIQFVPPITPQVMYGGFDGKMITISANPLKTENGDQDDSPVGIDISAKVDNDTVYFDKFPIKDIVFSIIKDEEKTNQILEAIGDVKYKVGYEARLNAAKDSVRFTLDPKSLNLEFAIPEPAPKEGEEVTPIKVEVKISAVEEFVNSYELSSTNMKFKFRADEVILGEGEKTIPVEFAPTVFDFDMKKAKGEK
ncbi:DUF4840 domain-containing protein [Bacteroides faecichinchillae]|uniref:DUF4840 domain-containing protein n=1 Tax=Bacteroides faecichinchillae TaxID=871325 RepID=UPI0010A6A6A1|nr:DUF4840 domain-containing protein [Bacteroides faecichinchillae]THG63525.1 DUF4840 domain-containing protein [Bacteroides faecichinchillae]